MKKHPELDDVQPELAKQIRDIMTRWYKGISNKELIANQLEAWALIPEPKTQYYTPAGEIAGELARLHIIELNDYQKSLEWALLAVEARREIPSGYDYLTTGVSYFELNDLENAYKYFDLSYNEGKYNVFTNYDKKYWQFYKSEKEKRNLKK